MSFDIKIIIIIIIIHFDRLRTDLEKKGFLFKGFAPPTKLVWLEF